MVKWAKRRDKLGDGEFGMDTYTLLCLKQIRTYCIAQGTVLNIL